MNGVTFSLLFLAGTGLTRVAGIKVGHFTLEERPTGCTVILTEGGAVAGADVRGGAPGTREIDLLSPVATVEEVHAIVLSGGSAFGLDAASGAVRFLEERGIGFDVGVAKVPIVPAAILFDLGVGGRPDVRPGPDCGYNAAKAASDGPVPEGSVGAGAGATVGKMGGLKRAMKGGIGTASIELSNGLVVAALVAVNAVGDVVDPATGEVVAGVRTEDGRGFADARKLLRLSGPPGGRPGENTTIGVVATNARLTKAQAAKVAQMAHDGLARAIYPAHTPADGDTLFALALGSFEGEANLAVLGALAADATAEAILSAVQKRRKRGRISRGAGSRIRLNPHLVFILIYSVVQILLGVVIGRWVKTTGAFFVAGRSLSPMLLFATLLAANIGAGSTVGAAALGYRGGISAWWWVGSAGIGTFALAFWVGPRIWRVAKEHDLQTMGDFLELRYGGTVRGIVSSLLWVATLFVLAAQLIAVARVLEAAAGVPKLWGALIGGVVMTAYFTAGGLLSSAWVNLVQLVVLYLGFLLALPVALRSIGGVEGIRDLGATVGGTYLDPWAGGARFIALLAPAFIISPGLIQKVYGARDERTVRLAVSLCAVLLSIFAWIPPLLGMVARAHFPDLASPDLALPTLLVERMPLLLGTLGLAAIFSAEVSSADAALFMLSTSLSRDLYLRFLRPQATDASVLRAARLAALLGGALGVVIALVFETVIDTLTIFYSILSVSLFVPVVAGLHCRKTGAVEALAAIGAGVLTLLAVQLRTAGQGYGIWTPTLLGMAVSAVAFVLVRRR